MKRIILTLTVFAQFLFLGLKAQKLDLLVTTDGDSIVCYITVLDIQFET